MNPLQLLRMTKWAHRPPSLLRVILVLSVLVACLVLAGLEFVFGWPDWLKVNQVRRPRF